jgi:hypothetical protein
MRRRTGARCADEKEDENLLSDDAGKTNMIP